MLLSGSALPLLATVALLLRRDLFSRKWKNAFLILGFILLSFAVFDTAQEHRNTFSYIDGIVAVITASITLFILSHFNHNHKHNLEEGGAKGIVVSEAFHSLIDGAVIGATYLISPLLGYAATLGIITHELPKVLGTIALFKSIGFTNKKTVLYSIASQIGSPVSASLIYILGKKIDHSHFQALEIASVSSLAVIVLWIVYLEIRYHRKHNHSHNDHHNHH